MKVDCLFSAFKDKSNCILSCRSSYFSNFYSWTQLKFTAKRIVNNVNVFLINSLEDNINKLVMKPQYFPYIYIFIFFSILSSRTPFLFHPFCCLHFEFNLLHRSQVGYKSFASELGNIFIIAPAMSPAFFLLMVLFL